MQTVIFAKAYRHSLKGNRVAVYPAGLEMQVTNEVATAAQKAGVLKEKAKDDGE